MPSLYLNVFAVLSEPDIARLRFASMVIVLVGGVGAGYLASNKFGVPETLAKKIMTILLVCFHWLIALLVIWHMQLKSEHIWLPIVGVVLMFLMAGLSTVLFLCFKVDPKTRFTLILAAALSNLGYTGGAFVCYAIFGFAGLALASIYPVLWMPTVYLILIPTLKAYELRSNNPDAKFKLIHALDCRLLIVPAVIIAIVLNLFRLKPPEFISRFHIIDILVYIASSLAFFAIGLRVNLPRLRRHTNLYLPVIVIKFILTPVVALLLVYILTMTGQNLTGLLRNVIIVLSLAPSAVVVVTMSNVFSLDAPLASAVWVVTMAVFVVIVVPVLFLIFS